MMMLNWPLFREPFLSRTVFCPFLTFDDDDDAKLASFLKTFSFQDGYFGTEELRRWVNFLLLEMHLFSFVENHDRYRGVAHHVTLVVARW